MRSFTIYNIEITYDALIQSFFSFFGAFLAGIIAVWIMRRQIKESRFIQKYNELSRFSKANARIIYIGVTMPELFRMIIDFNEGVTQKIDSYGDPENPKILNKGIDDILLKIEEKLKIVDSIDDDYILYGDSFLALEAMKTSCRAIIGLCKNTNLPFDEKLINSLKEIVEAYSRNYKKYQEIAVKYENELKKMDEGKITYLK